MKGKHTASRDASDVRRGLPVSLWRTRFTLRGCGLSDWIWSSYWMPTQLPPASRSRGKHFTWKSVGPTTVRLFKPAAAVAERIPPDLDALLLLLQSCCRRFVCFESFIRRARCREILTVGFRGILVAWWLRNEPYGCDIPALIPADGAPLLSVSLCTCFLSASPPTPPRGEKKRQNTTNEWNKMICAWKIREAERCATGECQLVEGKVGRWHTVSLWQRGLDTF